MTHELRRPRTVRTKEATEELGRQMAGFRDPENARGRAKPRGERAASAEQRERGERTRDDALFQRGRCRNREAAERRRPRRGAANSVDVVLARETDDDL